MADRIRPPRELEVILDRLKEDGLFVTKQKGMMFAAALGYALLGQEGGMEPDAFGEGIRIEYFDRVRDTGFIEALAVAKHEDLHFLAQEHATGRTELFEMYANAGLQKLKTVCYDRRGDPLQGLLELIDRHSMPRKEELPGLDEEAGRVDELLG